MRSCAHITNIIVREGLTEKSEVKDSISQIRDVVKYVTRQQFKTCGGHVDNTLDIVTHIVLFE